MAEVYADPDFVLTTVVRDRLPADVHVAVAADTDTPLEGRSVLIRAAAGVPTGNADPRAAGIWTVSVVVLARSPGEAQELTGEVFGLITDLEQTHVPEAGFISTVDAETLPVRSDPSAVPNSGQVFTQFNMQFTVRLRPYT